jgi:hypothetical protein
MNTGEFDSEFSDTQIAQNIYNEILKNPSKYKKVFTLKGNHSIDLYEFADGSDIMLYFFPQHDNFIYGYVTYECKNDGGIEIYSVYNRPMYFGLAQSVYNQYLIPKYDYVMSHNQHSQKGKNFWEKIVAFNIDKNITIYDTIDQKTVKNVNDSSDLNEFYGNTPNYERYRIKISNKI